MADDNPVEPIGPSGYRPPGRTDAFGVPPDDPAGPAVQLSESVLAYGGEAATATARLLSLPADQLTIVSAGPVAPMLVPLTERLRDTVPQRWSTVVLVADGAGAADRDLAPGQELADALGADVLAPNGPLLVVPDGSLYVLDRSGPGRVPRGAWWRFRPFYAPVVMGRRLPTPGWESDLAGFTDPGIPEVVVDELPAGLWVRRPGDAPPTDLAFAVLPEPRSVVLLVSRPGDPPLPAGALYRLVEALPEGVRARLLPVPYGDRPVADASLGKVLAGFTRQRVRVRCGISLRAAGGGRRIVAVDGSGTPTWRPFVHELAWPAGDATPQPLRWAAPADWLIPAGSGQFELGRGWIVELVESGLWIRPTDRSGGAGTVRTLPLQSAHCTVVIGTADADRRRPPWRRIARLLRNLPVDARRRLTMAMPRTVSDRYGRVVARWSAAELGGRPVHVLSTRATDPDAGAERRSAGDRRSTV